MEYDDIISLYGAEIPGRVRYKENGDPDFSHFSHTDLTSIAVPLLMKMGCSIAAAEIKTNIQEIPDAWGLMDDGTSILIECKTNTLDFERDLSKVSRNGRNLALGAYRYYFITEEQAANHKYNVKQLPRYWGLLVLRAPTDDSSKKFKLPITFSDITIGAEIVEVKKPISNPVRNLRGELMVLSKICAADRKYEQDHLIMKRNYKEYDF
jgi:hypothetical protein